MATLSLTLLRPADLLLAELRLADVEMIDADGDAPRVRTSAASTVSLVLPPQAMVETLIAPDATAARAAFAGPSRLTLELPPGTELPLRCEALLAAIAGASVRRSEFLESESTLIEVPWGLLLTPTTAATLDRTTPSVPSDAGIVGSWRVVVDPGDSGWRIVAGRDDPAELGGATPLGSQRKLLEQASRVAPVTGTLRLGAAGGSAQLALDTPDTMWRHDVALGRDQAVTLVTRGMLYPYGHRATLTQAWRRTALPEGDGGLATGMVLEAQRITLLERAVPVSRFDFPFDRVEIGVAMIDFATTLHVAEHQFAATGPLSDQVAAADADVSVRTAAINDRIAAQPHSVEAMIEQGYGSGPALAAARDAAAAAASELAQANAELANYDRILERLGKAQAVLDKAIRSGAEDTTSQQEMVDAVRAELDACPRPNPSAMPAIRQWAADTAVQRDALERACANDVAQMPRDIAALRALGDDDVAALDAATATAAELHKRLETLTATLASHRTISFMPGDTAGRAIMVPLTLADASQRIDALLPCLFVADFTLTAAEHGVDFVSLTDHSTQTQLAATWETFGGIDAGDIALDLVRVAPARPGDVQQLRHCRVAGAIDGGRYAPALVDVEVRLPALAMMVPGAPETAGLAFAPDDPEAPLRLDPPLPIDFAAAAERAGGLVLPRYAVDAISRDLGPAPAQALADVSAETAARIFGETRLLGYALADLLAAGGAAVPTPTVLPTGTGARFNWDGLRPGSIAGFTAHPDCLLTLNAMVDGGRVVTEAKLADFELSLPPTAPLVDIRFGALTCTIEGGRAPRIAIENPELRFRGELQLIENLRKKIGEALAATGSGIVIEQLPAGVRAGYRLRLPEVEAGAFLLRGIEAAVLVTIPFDGSPVEVELAFARPDNPFALSVMMFGGGGYLAATLRAGTLAKIDVSLNFGAIVAVNFGIVSAQVSAIGGIRLVGGADGYRFDAFLRFSGQIELLGIVSVGVSLRLLLSYREADGKRVLIGRATLVLEVDVLFLSRSLSLDSGEWVIAGTPIDDGARRRMTHAAALPDIGARRAANAAAWDAYRAAFAA